MQSVIIFAQEICETFCYVRVALSENPVISVMVGWMYNNTKDVKTAIDNTLRVSEPLRPCVKLENNNAKTQRRDGAKNKSLRV